ncbi:TonB-dependent receptor domain-containing protein [Sphingosinicella rhizophila]|uniref:TonB-dependent receptor n=1 Tax=Sphingosinicella rhizophila TaxID=3050082 RepID=A0ABU3Q613_9SPHN|nr:TonB-dependent receptor [Sphingosinicella sp. GR2756]MDT9598752.1 TonB-dependent receptor [Sphingosinicella sp. GR2756]
MNIRTIAAALSVGTCIAALAVPAHAQTTNYDIPQGSLKAALDAYGRQSGRPVIYRADDVRGVNTRGYRGTASPDQALEGLLAGTGFTARAGDAGSVAIVRAEVGGPSAEDSSADENGAGGEIVVTARKREETLSDVPAAITAFSGRDLEDIGADDFDDYALRVPGLGFTSLGAAGPRGIGPQINIRGLPDTGYYIGETPIPPSNLKLVDINRVEVLKGPQGTLYGTSSMGGLVKIVPNVANVRQLEMRGEGTLSSTKHGGLNYDVNAMINAPIIEDRLALRIVGYKLRKDGFIDRVPATDAFGGLDLGAIEEDVNVEKVWGLRASLVARPTDWLDIELNALHENQKSEDVGFYDTFVRDVTGNFGRLLPIKEPVENKISLYNLTLRADAGIFDITSATSLYKLDSYSVEDRTLLGNFYVGLLTAQGPSIVSSLVAAGLLPPGSTVVSPVNNSFFSVGSNSTDLDTKRWIQEIRLSSKAGGRLNWTIGGFFQDTSTTNLFFGEIPNAAAAATLSVNAPGIGLIPFPLLVNDIVINRLSDSDTRELGLFGEASYDFTDQFTLTLGGRLYKTKFASVLTDLSSSIFVPTVQNFPRASVSDSGFAPKANLSFRPDEDTMLYAQVSKGFRAGSFTNTSAFSPLCSAELAQFGITRGDIVPLKSDTLWSYEGGAKFSRMNRRLFVDAAVFYNDWSDLQQLFLLSCGVGFNVNAGKARSYGAELSIEARPAEGLTLGFAGGYLNTRITEGDPRATLQVGDSFNLSPKWMFAANGEYRFPLDGIGEGLNGYLRADYQYQGRTTFDFQNAPTSQKPSLDVVNARMGLVSDRWEAALFVDNLFNEESILADFTLSAVGTPVPIGTNNRRIRPFTPRTIGINVSVKY